MSLNEIRELGAGETIVMQDVTLQRLINPAFWVATPVFVLALGLIATGIIHNTLAALVGVTVLFGVSYLGSPLSDGLFIFDFTSSMRYIDWNVIFLIMGMMIVIAVIENTRIFQWLAFFCLPHLWRAHLASAADPDVDHRHCFRFSR